MFELWDKINRKKVKIYSVRSEGASTEFLVFQKGYGFVWNDSSYFRPLEGEDECRDIIKQTEWQYATGTAK